MEIEGQLEGVRGERYYTQAAADLGWLDQETLERVMQTPVWKIQKAQNDYTASYYKKPGENRAAAELDSLAADLRTQGYEEAQIGRIDVYKRQPLRKVLRDLCACRGGGLSCRLGGYGVCEGTERKRTVSQSSGSDCDTGRRKNGCGISADKVTERGL